MPLFCKACNEMVRVYELREHQKEHNPDAEKLLWSQIRACYELRVGEKDSSSLESDVKEALEERGRFT